MQLCCIGKKICYEVLGICDQWGRCVALEFLRNVEPHHEEAAAVLLDRMENWHPQQGPRKGSDTMTRSLGSKIWEWKKGSLRILWFETHAHGDAVACHGFVKPKRQRRTPPEEIELAVLARENYWRAEQQETLRLKPEERTN